MMRRAGLSKNLLLFMFWFQQSTINNVQLYKRSYLLLTISLKCPIEREDSLIFFCNSICTPIFACPRFLKSGHILKVFTLNWNLPKQARIGHLSKVFSNDLPTLKHCKSAKLPWHQNMKCIFSSEHFFDQMSEGSQVSKVTLCVKILKWHPPSHWPRSGIELPGQLKTEKKDKNR